MGKAPDAAPDLIDDLVHQFSDRFAFYRELIQNAIDAGSTRIEVTLRYAPAAGGGLLTAQVADWGEGMTREVIEQYLVTKFRSTKEDDLTKIGKFGIGFLSVFAPGPELVVVETGRDGEDWRILFHPDHTYELLRAPEPVEGTRVSIHKEMSPSDYRVFVARSEESVRRWCRHSESDIAFAAGGEDGSAPGPPHSVREPVTAEAVFQVEHRDERTWVVAGPARDDPPRVGFYNRGLTLLESREPLVPGVSFKVVSDLLEHTLTRDNVRRDRQFESVLDRVRALERGPIRKRLPDELRRAAAPGGDAADYVALLRFARGRLDDDDLVFPGVTGPVEAAALRRSVRTLGCVAAGEAGGPVEQALQAADHPVLRLAGGAQDPVREAVEALAGPIRPAAEAFSVALAGGGAPAEAELCVSLRRLLQAAGAEIASALVATVHGSGAGEVAILVDGPGSVEPAVRAASSPFARGGPRVIALNRGHAAVADALRLAATRPRLAAYLCARLVSVTHGALDDEADRRLTAGALAS